MRTLLLLAAILFFFLSLTCFAAAASIDKKKPRKPAAVEDDVPEARDVPQNVPAKPQVSPPIESKSVPKMSSPMSMSSTAYCLTGTMANGQKTHPGVVAMDGVRFGTQVSVLSGPLAGRTFTVKDRTDGKTQADFWFSSCQEAIQYGRRRVQVEIR